MTNQSVNQSISQSISQLIDQPIKQIDTEMVASLPFLSVIRLGRRTCNYSMNCLENDLNIVPLVKPVSIQELKGTGRGT